jgi:crotonobetainyl-CoA:carnitine CoA-transferase CaiB-like acyl-CoA transferase
LAGPLSGTRVVDLSRAMAGPFCTQLLGDMGAEVIKIESPKGGDETRQWGPFWNGVSCYFLSANRNKKSIVVDLKTQEGRNIVLTLAGRSDVFVENFRPRTVERLGIDYGTLAELNPRLVYCSLSGFGQDGPRAQEPAYDLLMQGFAGLMGLTGVPDEPPVRAGLPVTDLAAALFAVSGILAALYQRERDGKGQAVRTSLLQGQLSWLSYYLVGYFADGTVPHGMGSAHHSLAPYQAYRASDGHFIVAVGNDAQWQRLCAAIGLPQLAGDARFSTNRERVANRQAMDSILNGLFLKRPVAEWIRCITQAEVPCGPINTVDLIAADPQVTHLGTLQQIAHPSIPDLKLCASPIDFSRTPGAIQSPPPLHGQHTDEILAQLGYNADGIRELREKEVVA